MFNRLHFTVYFLIQLLTHIKKLQLTLMQGLEKQKSAAMVVFKQAN